MPSLHPYPHPDVGFLIPYLSGCTSHLSQNLGVDPGFMGLPSLITYPYPIPSSHSFQLTPLLHNSCPSESISSHLDPFNSLLMEVWISIFSSSSRPYAILHIVCQNGLNHKSNHTPYIHQSPFALAYIRSLIPGLCPLLFLHSQHFISSAPARD